MRIYFKILAIALLLSSCDTAEVASFGDVTNQTFVMFRSQQSNLAVTIDDTGVTNIPVDITTVSSSERVVTVEIDPESTANPENYTAPSTVTIPANEYSAPLTITGVDNSVETSPETIIVNLISVEGGVVSQTQHTVSIFQVCPVESDYLVGDYILTDNTTTATPNFGSGVPVTISVDPDDENAREFVTTFLPTTGVARDVDVRIRLICNKFFLDVIDINVTCTQDTSFIVGTAPDASASTYDTADDTEVTVNYLEDVEADCGPTLVQSFTLTKV